MSKSLFARKKQEVKSEVLALVSRTNPEATLNGVQIATIADVNASNVTLNAVGNAPNNNGAILVGQQLTLEPADGTHPGLLSATSQTIGGAKTFLSAISAPNLSGAGVNTGDVTLTAVGNAPNADAASLSGQVLTLQPADGTNPGVVTALAQTFGGDKTFLGNVVMSGTLTTGGNLNTGDVTLTPVGNAPNANGALLTGQALTLEPADATHPGLVLSSAQSFGGLKTFSAGLAANANVNILDGTSTIQHQGVPIYHSGSAVANNSVYLGQNAGNTAAVAVSSVGVGFDCLNSITSADFSTAMGFHSGINLTTGQQNSFYGAQSGSAATNATQCTAIGYAAMSACPIGTRNIAVGYNAGNALTTTDSHNICLDNTGVAGDNGQIRIGIAGVHSNCTVAGISGVTSAGATAVVVNASGLLGTVVSSKKYKRDISELYEGDSERIYKLKAKRFRYKEAPEEDQVGFIAEEVKDVLPEIVLYEQKDGKDDPEDPKTIRYDQVWPLLLDQVQKHEKMLLESREEIKKLQELLPK